MATVAIWIVVLRLAKKNAEQLLAYAYQVINLMTGDPDPNPYFLSPNPTPANPTLAQATTSADALRDALAMAPGKARTSAIKTAVTNMNADLTALGTNYVQLVANLSTHIETGYDVITSAGMEYRRAGGQVKAEDLIVKFVVPNNGDVKARDKRYDKGTIYRWNVKLETDTNWVCVKTGNGSTYTYKNISNMVRTQFQVERIFKDETTTMSSIKQLPTQ